MSKTYDVAVRGAGLVAHTLALLLSRDRLKVALVQPDAPATGERHPDVRAYALNHASRALLQHLKVWPDDTAVTAVKQMWLSEPDADDPATLRFEAPSPHDELAWIVDVPALEDTLRQAVRFQAGVDTLETAPPARLTVICEGKRSATRDEMGFEFDVKPYEHTAVAARLDCARPHGGVARQWFLHGDVLALLPMGGDEGCSVALVWSVSHDRARELLAADASAFETNLMAACDHALGDMKLQGPPGGWPLELSQARHWVKPGVALAGDAAHAMHPLAGQGLNIGLGDAAALATLLHEREYWREPGDLKLLRRYERARKADFQRMAGVTEGLYGLFGHHDDRMQTLRRWGMRNFDRLAPLKRWAIRQATGQHPSHPFSRNP
jgi:2-polyprenyl-6-methoxyphenol hydroxylase-like FAD-dependent oxidoreductase